MNPSDDEYVKISCPNCESQYAVDYMTSNVDGNPDYCPFCSEEIPEEDEDYEDEREGEDEGQW